MKSPIWSLPHIPNIQTFIHRSRVLRVYRAFLRCTETEEERIQVRNQFKSNRDITSIVEARRLLKNAENILSSLVNQRAPKALIPDTQLKVKKGEWPWERS
jgi:hypothetical protein